MSNTVLPRPGSTFEPTDPIPGPSEQAFTNTFGALLPPAQYLTTSAGRAAYYTFPATVTPQPTDPTSQIPAKVLLIHGVQTPALGLLPLITALRRAFPQTAFATLDLWGHGLSDTPRRAHEGGLFHGLIDSVLLRLGWKGAAGVCVVGYSFGGVVSMGYLASSLNRASESGSEGESKSGNVQVASCVLVAPAGLVRSAWFTAQQREWLGPECPPAEEAQARDFVIETLEGETLPVRVPADWRQRVQRGEVVAQAIKEWQLAHHQGHAASVVGVFRDGGVIDNDALFVEAKGLGIPSLIVLGEMDGLSTEEEIRRFGFEVEVVRGAGHGVVRENADEVAEYIGRFWRAL